jgi:hypothetical protein
MKIQNLIRQLEKCDSNAEIRFITFCGTVEGTIKKISADVRSSSKNGYCVYLEGKITHYEGKDIQKTCTAGNNGVLGTP